MYIIIHKLHTYMYIKLLCHSWIVWFRMEKLFQIIDKYFGIAYGQTMKVQDLNSLGKIKKLF